MVAPALTKPRKIDPPTTHPAALLFPTRADDDQYVTQLAEHLAVARSDQPAAQAIVLTPDGQLLEGRGRWAAYRKLGQVPVTRFERTVNPWLYVVRANEDTLLAMDKGRRAMVLGRVPLLGVIGVSYVDEPPTRDELARVAQISTTAIARATLAHKTCIPELIKLCDAGIVAPNMATKIGELDRDHQLQYTKLVAGGMHPRTAHIRMGLTGQHGEVKAEKIKAKAKEEPAVPPPTKTPVRNRNKYVREPAVLELSGTLAALSYVLDAAEDLDPAITPDRARTLLADLGRAHTNYRRITELLKQRKESQS